MWKSLIDIDVRKVTAVISILVVLELAIAQGTISLTDAIPASWIPIVVAWSKILAVVGSAITGTHNVAALFSPRSDMPSGTSAAKVLAILFVVGLASLLDGGTSLVQAQGKKPTDCLAVDPRPACKNGIFAPGGHSSPASTSSNDPQVACDFHIFIGLTPANLEQAIKQCVSDVNSTLADDTARALASAQAYPDNDGINCLKPGLAILQAGIIVPAVSAQPAVPANPNATPPTPEIPAVAAVPAQNPGLILLFQKYREFILSGGLTSCQTWVNTPVNATVAQGLSNTGSVAGVAAAAAALMPK